MSAAIAFMFVALWFRDGVELRQHYSQESPSMDTADGVFGVNDRRYRRRAGTA
jgi:hypothetical protein